MKNYSIIFSVIAITLLLLTGCGQNAAPKEEGGDTTKNNNGTTKIDTGEGKIELGNNVELPDDFPDDVYIIEGNISSLLREEKKSKLSLHIETNKSFKAAQKAYIKESKERGWSKKTTVDVPKMPTIHFEKNGRKLNVTVQHKSTTMNDKTLITLSVDKK